MYEEDYTLRNMTHLLATLADAHSKLERTPQTCKDAEHLSKLIREQADKVVAYEPEARACANTAMPGMVIHKP